MWMTAAFVLGEVTAYRIGRTAFMQVLGTFFILTGLSAAVCAGIWREIRIGSVGGNPAGQERKTAGLRIVFFCLLFMAGGLRMAQEQRADPLEMLLERDGARENAVVTGMLEDISEKNDWYSLVLSDVTVKISGTAYRQKRLALQGRGADIPALVFLSCGTEVTAGGTAELPDEARNPGEFSYRLYYRGLKIKCCLQADWIEAGEKTGSLLQRQADRFRTYAREAIFTLCTQRDAGVFCAVLLGDKSELDGELQSLFEDSGIAHILAVSGLHVSLIGMSLYGILRKLGFGYGLAGGVSALALFFYGTVTGFGASVFRAVFMVFCSMAAACLGRSYDLLSAMSLSMFLLAFDSPFILFSGGFQLSYGAVTVIGLEQDLQRQRKRRRIQSGSRNENAVSSAGSISGRKRGLLTGIFSVLFPPFTEALRMSASVQFYTLPILLYHFFSFPPWGVFLNLLVIPLMSYAAGAGIFSLVFFGIYEGLSFAVSGDGGMISGGVRMLAQGFRAAAYGAIGPGHYIFLLYDILCRWSRRVPFSSLLPGRPGWLPIILFYLFLIWRYLRESTNNHTAKTVRGQKYGKYLSDVVPGAAAVLLFVHPVRGMNVWFLDVGQGDSVFIQTGDMSILSDCGSSQDRSVGEDRLLPFLQSRGVRTLDYVFVSHADEDHVNGIKWLLESCSEIEIRCLVLPAAGEGMAEYDRLVDAALSRGAEVFYWDQGDGMSEGHLRVECLCPWENTGGEDRNAHSLVLLVQWKNFSALLTGDVGIREEERISAEWSEADHSPVSVLKAAHHGSGDSSSDGFLKTVSPSVYILSYGEGNPYGHPSQDAVKRMKKSGGLIYRTAESGAICIHTDGKTMEIEPFLEKAGGQEAKNGA